MPHLQIRPVGTSGSTTDNPSQTSIVRHLTTIGSAPENDITLSGSEIASSHATITHEPGKYQIEAVDRKCLIFVNGRKTKRHELQHGDLIGIGQFEIGFSAIDEPVQKTAVGEAKNDQNQLQAMRRLHDFSRLLTRSGDLDGLLDELIDQIVALTKAGKGFLVLAEGDSYSIRVARNLERQPVDDPERVLSDDIIRDVITSKKAQIISDALHDGRFQNSLSVINLKLSSVMCVPMLVQGELLGVIYVGNDSVVNLFRPEQLEILEVFAAQAALFIKNAQAFLAEQKRGDYLQDRLERYRFGAIIGSCPQMIEVYRRVEKVASTDVTVLVTGETGTGKELIATEIHNRSERRDGPFVAVNCGALPENLIESELFGHLKGSFTGAVGNKAGKFQAANKGTIFLDEIGELPLNLQVKLLRVLQEHAVQPVGANQSEEIDIRVVAATNRDLKAEVDAGRFREDLYFRLNVISIELPPLRERGQDIELLARYLVGRYSKEFRRNFDAEHCFDTSALQAIRKFIWPGNIRQLENHIKKALVLAEGSQITAQDLDLELPRGSGSPDDILPLSDAREAWQRDYINRALALHAGNRTRTARALGVDPRTIFRHLEKVEKEKNATDG